MSAALQISPVASAAVATPANYQETLDAGRCPVCAALRHDEFQEVCRWVGENVANAENRRVVDAAGGFCNLHLWRLSEVHSPHSGSLLHAYLAERFLLSLAARAARDACAPGEWLAQAARECPLCAFARACESRHLVAFVDWLRDEANRAHCLASRGLCLPHWLRCARLISDARLRAELAQAFLRQLRQLQTEMREYVRKFDGGQRWEVLPAEAAAWRRAAEKLVGRLDVRPFDPATEALP